MTTYNERQQNAVKIWSMSSWVCPTIKMFNRVDRNFFFATIVARNIPVSLFLLD